MSAFAPLNFRTNRAGASSNSRSDRVTRGLEERTLGARNRWVLWRGARRFAARVFGRRGGVIAAAVVGSLLVGGLVPGPAQAATEPPLSSFLTAAFSGTAQAGSRMQLDVEMDWVAAASKAPNSIGGSSGMAYYKNFVAATNEASDLPAFNQDFGFEHFAIFGPGNPTMPYPALPPAVHSLTPKVPAGWIFDEPYERQGRGFGFRSFDVDVPNNAPAGPYLVTVTWRFAPRGAWKETVTASVDVPITLVAAPKNPADVSPVITKGILNGDLELGESSWVTGGDGTVNLNRKIARKGSGYAQLGGPPAAGQEPAARIGWLSESSLVVPTEKHSTLKFDQKTTTSESEKIAYDQFSVIVNDADGPHLQAAWTNLEATAAKSGYKSMAINLDAYEGKTISLTFLLTQDFLNPTTVLLDNITVESTTRASPAGTLSKSTGFLAGISAESGKGGALIAGALITIGAVATMLELAGIKTGLAAYVAALTGFPLVAAVVLAVAAVGYGAYLVYDARFNVKVDLAVSSSKLTGEAMAAVTNTKNARQDPSYSYIVALTPTPSSTLTAVATEIAVEYSTLITTTEPVPTPVKPEYFYTQISGFAAEMTTGTANRMKKSALTPGSQILLVDRDTPVIEFSETWPSPVGTAGHDTNDPPTDRKIEVIRPETNFGTKITADLWNLARISQRTINPKPTIYAPLNTGVGVIAYIVDSGLAATIPGPVADSRVMNPEYNDLHDATRIIDAYQVPPSGEQAIPDAHTRVMQMGDDPHKSHGSRVAAVLASNTYGASPGVKVIPVGTRIITDGVYSAGSSKQLLDGLDWVLQRVRANPGDVFVFNMSLGTPGFAASQTKLMRKVLTEISEKGLVSLGAGNEGADACEYGGSAALSLLNSGANGVVVAGSVDKEDKAANNSNWGECVSLYAPGVKIPVPVSAAEPTRGGLFSGTSFSAPLVAGVAAQLLASSFADAGGTLTPVLLKKLLVGRATPGAVRELKFTEGVIQGLPGSTNLYLGEATPAENRILYAGSECSGSDPRWSTNNTPGTASKPVMAIPTPTRDPACPTHILFNAKIAIKLSEGMVKGTQGYTGSLTEMQNVEGQEPRELRDPVTFKIDYFLDRKSTANGNKVTVTMTSQMMQLISDPTDPLRWWKFTPDPDPKYSKIVIQSLKITWRNHPD